MTQEVDTSILTTFKDTCMKLLCDEKAMEELEDLIDKCANKERTSTKQCTIRNIGKNKAQKGHEIRLTT